ncbi:MAG: hypothetical protein LBQ66_11620 [Planctomycetaceae bacterium]|nr:hypothetical protein [Planctomycetaceae bacterium]
MLSYILVALATASCITAGSRHTPTVKSRSDGIIECGDTSIQPVRIRKQDACVTSKKFMD